MISPRSRPRRRGLESPLRSLPPLPREGSSAPPPRLRRGGLSAGSEGVVGVVGVVGAPGGGAGAGAGAGAGVVGPGSVGAGAGGDPCFGQRSSFKIGRPLTIHAGSCLAVAGEAEKVEPANAASTSSARHDDRYPSRFFIPVIDPSPCAPSLGPPSSREAIKSPGNCGYATCCSPALQAGTVAYLRARARRRWVGPGPGDNQDAHGPPFRGASGRGRGRSSLPRQLGVRPATARVRLSLK